MAGLPERPILDQGEAKFGMFNDYPYEAVDSINQRCYGLPMSTSL